MNRNKVVIGSALLAVSLVTAMHVIQPTPSFDDLTLHSGEILQTRRTTLKNGMPGNHIMIDVKGDGHDSIRVPYYKSTPLLLTKRGKDVDIYSWLTYESQPRNAWHVVFDGTVLYSYEFRKSNQQKADKLFLSILAIGWPPYLAWLLYPAFKSTKYRQPHA